MKKSLCLLLALCLLATLCACGASPAAPAASPAAEAAAPEEAAPEEAAPEEPEQLYVEKTLALPVRKTEHVISSLELEDLGPVSFSDYRVTETRYDEHGRPAETLVSLVDEDAWIFRETADFLSDMEAEPLDDEAWEGEGRDDEPFGNWFGSKELSPDGQLLSVTKPSEVLFPGDNLLVETGFYEQGLLTRIERSIWGAEELAEVTTREFYPDGTLRKATTERPIAALLHVYHFDPPLVEVREYDQAGRCTHLHLESVNDEIGGLPVRDLRWTFDEAGQPVTLSLAEGLGQESPLDGVAQPRAEAAMEYDEAGRMIAAVWTEDGQTTEYRYEYDENGRLIATRRHTGDRDCDSVYEYDENGLLIRDRRPDGDLSYTWTVDDRGERRMKLSGGDYHKSAFPLQNTSYSPEERSNLQGEVTDTCRLVLMPSAADLEPRCVAFTEETDYENFTVTVPVTAEEQAAMARQRELLAAYFPVLPEILDGVPVPVPVGDRKPLQIRIRYASYYLEQILDFHYDEDGMLQEVEESFDPVGSYKKGSTHQTADTQGRLVDYWPTEKIHIQYRYGSDPNEYTCIRDFGSGPEEKLCRLEDMALLQWIQDPPGEGAYAEFDDDGWLLHYFTGNDAHLYYTYG